MAAADYLTVGGATVGLSLPEAPPNCDNVHVDAECSGCGGYRLACMPVGVDGQDRVETMARAEADIRAWAQSHASECRAIPKGDAR